MKEAFINHHNIISSLGFTSEANFEQLIRENSGIKKYQRDNNDVYYSSKVDLEKVNTAFNKIGDSDSYTLLERMMILSVNTILKSSGPTTPMMYPFLLQIEQLQRITFSNPFSGTLTSASIPPQ